MTRIFSKEQDVEFAKAEWQTNQKEKQKTERIT